MVANLSSVAESRGQIPAPCKCCKAASAAGSAVAVISTAAASAAATAVTVVVAAASAAAEAAKKRKGQRPQKIRRGLALRAFTIGLVCYSWRCIYFCDDYKHVHHPFTIYTMGNGHNEGW